MSDFPGHPRLRHRRGASGAEAGLLIGLVAVVAIASVSLTGSETARIMGVSANMVTPDENGVPLGERANTPAMSLAGGSANEGETITFTVGADKAVDEPVTISLAPAGGSATAEADFTVSGSVTLPAGATSASVEVATVEDGLYEGSENFTLRIAGASRGKIVGAAAQGNIVDNESFPVLIVANANATEGVGAINFAASLEPASASDVTISYEAASGSATAGSDFVGGASQTTIAPGALSTTISIPLIDDSTPESNESFSLQVSVEGAFFSGSVTGTIFDDDETPLGYNSSHSEEDCVAAGGAVVTAGAAKICRFKQHACKTGWSQYQNWSITRNKICNYKRWWESANGGLQTCNTLSTFTSGGHSWANRAIEQTSHISSNRAPCSGPTRVYCTATRTYIGCI